MCLNIVTLAAQILCVWKSRCMMNALKLIALLPKHEKKITIKLLIGCLVVSSCTA